jgi:tetrahydromethanopterin S-methyltransferase subunit A
LNIIELAGQLCKILLPIKEEVFYGNSEASIAICTLSSIDLLKNISNSGLMNNISLAGRLLSENKGIDALIRHVIKSPNLDTIIVCGNDVRGHMAGHALFCAHKYGIDEQNRIINSVSPDPVLTVSKSEIGQFQNQVTLIDEIGQIDLEKIRTFVRSIQ